MKLGGGLEVFNGYVNPRHLGNTKAVKVSNHVIPLSKKPPNPLKRLLGAQGLEPWTRYLKGRCHFNDINDLQIKSAKHWYFSPLQPFVSDKKCKTF